MNVRPTPGAALRILVTLIGLLSTAGAEASFVHVSGSVADLRANHAMVLVCHDPSGEVVAAIKPYLEAFAEAYGADGLAVLIADRNEGEEHVLALWGAETQPLLVQDQQSLDLWAVYRTCERRLRGRRPGTYHAHVAEVLQTLADADVLARCHQDGRSHAVADLLDAVGGSYLLLPPGCNECQLSRHEDALHQLQARHPALPVLCFDAEAAAVLTQAGWSGDTYILPLDTPARMLSLRQAGAYAPVVVGRTGGAASLSVRSLHEEVAAWDVR